MAMVRPPVTRPLAVAACAVVLSLTAGCVGGASRADGTSASPTGTTASAAGSTATWPSTPGGPATSLARGQLLTDAPLTGAAALPSAARNALITYVSQGPDGRPVVVSGTVSTPAGNPPEGGWPVLNWAHGTTGWADTCAPSLDTADGPEHDYLGGVSDVIDTWVSKGYAVVRTDYVGLGTPGGHPYLDGGSEADAVIDILRAARQLDPSIGARWVVAGHSQGGQATLFTAAEAAAQAPDLPLLGAVAIAPGGVHVGDAVAGLASGQGSEALEAFLPVILLGAQSAGVDVVPDQVLADQALPGLAVGRAQCLGQGREIAAVPLDAYLRPGADLTGVVDYLDQQDPRTVTPRVPVMVAQGTADTVVPPAGTLELVQKYCAAGLDVDLRQYDGQDHRGAVTASKDDAQQYVAALFAGSTPSSTCGS